MSRSFSGPPSSYLCSSPPSLWYLVGVLVCVDDFSGGVCTWGAHCVIQPFMAHLVFGFGIAICVLLFAMLFSPLCFVDPDPRLLSVHNYEHYGTDSSP